jgi:protein O-mannosyl-transferase
MAIFKNLRFQTYFLFGLAIVLYSNTLWHEFVLDDDVVIVRNTYVQQGLKGIPAIFGNDSFAGFSLVGEGESLLEGGRYRPLSLAFFALIHSLFGANPFVFHLFAVLAYALTCLLLFKWLQLAFQTTENSTWIVFFIALLFVVHPVHTEVVANVKSVDETFAVLFGISSLIGLFKSFDHNSKMWLLLSGIFMLLACLSKENAITFVIIAPLALWYFREIKFSSILLRSIPVLAGGLLFVLIRHFAIGDQSEGTVMHDPLNNPFLEWGEQSWIEASSGSKAATIIYILGQYLRLMIFPHPLIHGYYPFHFQLQTFSSPLVIVSMVLFAAMVAYGVWSLRSRVKAGFGILFFLVSISVVSNIVFQIGSFMAERFLFLPSIGLILTIVVWGIGQRGSKQKTIATYFFMLVAVVFSVITFLRNPDWKNNESLFRADTLHSPNSAKFQNELGTILLDNALKTTNIAQQKGLFREALPHLAQAIELHPTYFDAYLALGACAYYAGELEHSVLAYRTASNLFPADEKSKLGLWYALQAYGKAQWEKGETENGLAALEEAWDIRADDNLATQIGTYYESLGRKEEAQKWKGRTGFIIDK